MIERHLVSNSKCIIIRTKVRCGTSASIRCRQVSSCLPYPSAFRPTILSLQHARHVPLIKAKSFSQSAVEGVKTRASVKLDDLPQGVIPLDGLPLEDTRPPFPTAILQVQRNMRKFENCVLLTRVGGFYELYFEHALEYGPLLNLKPADKRISREPVPMVSIAGISDVIAYGTVVVNCL